MVVGSCFHPTLELLRAASGRLGVALRRSRVLLVIAVLLLLPAVTIVVVLWLLVLVPLTLYLIHLAALLFAWRLLVVWLAGGCCLRLCWLLL